MDDTHLPDKGRVCSFLPTGPTIPQEQRTDVKGWSLFCQKDLAMTGYFNVMQANWVFHQRKSMFALETFTNSSSHESLYRQVKYGFASVLALMDAHQSGQSLSIQADVSYNWLKRKAGKDQTWYTGWLSNPNLTSRLTKRGAGLSEAEWNQSNDYRSTFDPQESKFWLIVMDVYNNNDSAHHLFFTSFAPKFCHVRMV
jgi:hypothetical protein